MKNFNEIYIKIRKEYEAPIEAMRQQSKNKITAVSVIAILIGLFLTIVFAQTFVDGIIFFVLSFIVGLTYSVLSKDKNEYTKYFKEKVIKTFVKEYSEALEYRSEQGISPNIYKEGEFERYDSYSTEDLITGTLNEKYKIIMAEVYTESESTDSEGHTSYTTLFHGLFAKIEFDKNLNTNMKIRRNSEALFRKKEKLEMDSSEFEEKFDVYSEDKIIAMQLLTSDIMQMLLDFKEKNKITPEMTLKGNTLYIRFSTGDMFEPMLLKKALDYDTLKKYYDTINFTLDITEKFLKNIEETEN